MLMSSLMYCSWLLRAFTVINLHWTILWLLFGHSLLHVFQSLYCGHWLFRQVLKFSSLGFVLLVLLIDSSLYWRDVPGYKPAPSSCQTGINNEIPNETFNKDDGNTRYRYFNFKWKYHALCCNVEKCCVFLFLFLFKIINPVYFHHSKHSPKQFCFLTFLSIALNLDCYL